MTSRLGRTWHRWLAIATISVGFIIMVGLWSTDLYVPERGNSEGPSFCGSAYDVILVKRNGYMGGEMPPNQDAIDRACREKSVGPVLRGAVAGAAGLAFGGLVAVTGGRRSQSSRSRSRQTAPRD